MNPIQKAWLKLLTPFSYLINEKLAKRPGFFGKIGKFFIIGPREFGYHPINKVLIAMNTQVIQVLAFVGHRYSIIKGLTHNGFNVLRPTRHLSLLGPIFVFVYMTRLYYQPTFAKHEYNPDRFHWLRDKTGSHLALPLGAMNDRLSAHYLEISDIYTAEMIKRVKPILIKYVKVSRKIKEERDSHSDEEKKTKFARAGYKYIPTVAPIFPRGN